MFAAMLTNDVRRDDFELSLVALVRTEVARERMEPKSLFAGCRRTGSRKW